MKNQHFGDNRDLMKFDLVYQIVKKEGLVDRFTYIPMLTEGKNDGGEIVTDRAQATAGLANQDLVEFLNTVVLDANRDISQLEEFFKGQGIAAYIYQKENYFTHAERKAYFAGIRQDYLTKSLILVDPDKGLEEDKNTAENLLFSELGNLNWRMDDESILMFTQRFPYDLYEAYLGMRYAEIKDRVPGSQPISIDDLDTIIFFLTKNKFIQGQLVNLLKEYTRQYGRS